MPDITPDQIVALNLRRARELLRLTQDEAALRLEPWLGERWSRFAFSATERSATSGRTRHFNATQIVAFAAAFELPVGFFLKPSDAMPDTTRIGATGAENTLTPSQLSDLALASAADVELRLRDLQEEFMQRWLSEVSSGKYKIVPVEPEEDR